MAEVASPPRLQRAGSVSSAGTAMSASSLSFAPRFVPRPEPAYVSLAAADDHVTRLTMHDQYDVRSPTASPSGEPASFSETSLHLINGFLDALLYNILAKARGTSMSRLRPAIKQVLSGKLARDALQVADEEMLDLVDEAEVSMDQEEARSASRADGWHLEEAFKLMRLRVMVFCKLGLFDDEDEEQFLEEDENPNSDLSILEGPSAVFLASILEYLTERLLDIAGEAAFDRSRRASNLKTPTIRESRELENTKRDQIVVEEMDVNKIALNPSFARLWRTWRKSQPQGASSQGPALARERLSRRASQETTATKANPDRQIALEDVPEGEVAEHDIAANIPLPMTDNDIDEIEIPGLAKQLLDDGTEAPEPIEPTARERWIPKRPGSALFADSDTASGSRPALKRLRSSSAPMLYMPGAFTYDNEASAGVLEEPTTEGQELESSTDTATEAEKQVESGDIPGTSADTSETLPESTVEKEAADTGPVPEKELTKDLSQAVDAKPLDETVQDADSNVQISEIPSPAVDKASSSNAQDPIDAAAQPQDAALPEAKTPIEDMDKSDEKAAAGDGTNVTEGVVTGALVGAAALGTAAIATVVGAKKSSPNSLLLAGELPKKVDIGAVETSSITKAAGTSVKQRAAAFQSAPTGVEPGLRGPSPAPSSRPSFPRGLSSDATSSNKAASSTTGATSKPGEGLISLRAGIVQPAASTTRALQATEVKTLPVKDQAAEKSPTSSVETVIPVEQDKDVEQTETKQSDKTPASIPPSSVAVAAQRVVTPPPKIVPANAPSVATDEEVAKVSPMQPMPAMRDVIQVRQPSGSSSSAVPPISKPRAIIVDDEYDPFAPSNFNAKPKAVSEPQAESPVSPVSPIEPQSDTDAYTLEADPRNQFYPASQGLPPSKPLPDLPRATRSPGLKQVEYKAPAPTGNLYGQAPAVQPPAGDHIYQQRRRVDEPVDDQAIGVARTSNVKIHPPSSPTPDQNPYFNSDSRAAESKRNSATGSRASSSLADRQIHSATAVVIGSSEDNSVAKRSSASSRYNSTSPSPIIQQNRAAASVTPPERTSSRGKDRATASSNVTQQQQQQQQQKIVHERLESVSSDYSQPDPIRASRDLVHEATIAQASRGQKVPPLQTTFTPAAVSNDEAARPASSNYSKGSRGSIASTPHKKEASGEQKGRDFDDLVNSNETVKFTLTPDGLRDHKFFNGAVVNNRAPSSATSTTVDRPGSAANVKRPSPPGSKSGSQAAPAVQPVNHPVTQPAVAQTISSAAPPPISKIASQPVVRITPQPTVQAVPQPNEPKRRVIPRPSQYRQAAELLALNSRPQLMNHTNPRNPRLVPREPRVMTERMSDFADFMRSTAPSTESQGTPHVLAVSNRLSAQTTSSLRKSRSRLEARDANAKGAGGSRDLIEFIRQGPQGSGAVPGGYGMNQAGNFGLSISNGANGQSNGIGARGQAGIAPAVQASTSSAAAAGRKQYRNKDPYAIDISDDEDDYTLPVTNGTTYASSPPNDTYLRSASPPTTYNGLSGMNGLNGVNGLGVHHSNGNGANIPPRSTSAASYNTPSVPRTGPKPRFEARNAGRTETFGEERPSTAALADFLKSSAPPAAAARTAPAPDVPAVKRLGRESSVASSSDSKKASRKFWQRK